MLIYKCDGCKAEIDSDVEILTISCNNQSLSVVKSESGQTTNEMTNFKSIHFCSAECFTERFFKRKKVTNK